MAQRRHYVKLWSGSHATDRHYLPAKLEEAFTNQRRFINPIDISAFGGRKFTDDKATRRQDLGPKDVVQDIQALAKDGRRQS